MKINRSISNAIVVGLFMTGSTLSAAETAHRYTLKGPAPTPVLNPAQLSVTAGVAGTVSSRSAIDTISPKGVHWETGVLFNMPQFALFGSVAFNHGIGSAVYEILTDSSKTGQLKNYSYGSPEFSIEALKPVVNSNPFSLTLGIGGTVSMEFGQQFIASKTGSGSGSSSGTAYPFGGSFYGTAIEEFGKGALVWGMYQRVHWNWVESNGSTASSDNGLSLAEQGFSMTLKKMHRIHAGFGVNLNKESDADIKYPLSCALGYSWIGKIKK